MYCLIRWYTLAGLCMSLCTLKYTCHVYVSCIRVMYTCHVYVSCIRVMYTFMYTCHVYMSCIRENNVDFL